MKSLIAGERKRLAVNGPGSQVIAAARDDVQKAPGGAVEIDWCGGAFRRGCGCWKIAAAVGKDGEKGEYQ